MVKSPKLLNQIQIHTLHQPRGISIIITIHSILLLNHCEKEIKSKKGGGGGAVRAGFGAFSFKKIIWISFRTSCQYFYRILIDHI
jgi:hypothetical protein